VRPPSGPAPLRAYTGRMGAPVEVEEGSSSGVSSCCLQGLSPLAGPETGAGGADREADKWGGSGGPAASGWSGMAAAYGGGFTSKSKSIKYGWRIGSSCRTGFLGELTGMGVFPNTASIIGRSAGDSWINGCSQERGSSTKVCHIRI
jgi:hypothetical protein